jgi:leucyl-tRNA synthetase
MKYFHNEIEEKWQKFWAENQTFKASNNSNKPKFYALDMFPYPSGAGLHVGHPLGYIASDIYARYKRHKGFNVLHPQGYDSFGLPAEQYAIQTGQHPAKTTETNIATYRKQLDRIGFSFDWSREVRTSNPDFYKHTQWIFTKLFNSYYCNIDNKAFPISKLITELEKNGNAKVNSPCDEDTPQITAEDWNNFSDKEKQEFLLKYRMTYLSETTVNWCAELGTVLANDEIVNGVSERGGHPVVQKKMMQWSMRIAAYAQRLLDDLNGLDWPQPIKDIQTNWIGRSEGAMVTFPILSFPKGEEKAGFENQNGDSYGYMTGGNNSHLLIEKAQEMRANPTQAEAALWEMLRGKKLANYKFRQQHLIADYIVDFVCLKKKLVIEVDGKIHEDQQEKDQERTLALGDKGYTVIRFKNEEVLGNIDEVLKSIETKLNSLPKIFEEKNKEVLSLGKDLGWDISVFTTRPDTIFGVSFMTLAPEHELVSKITTPEQKEEVEAYIKATAKRSERDRMSDVKTISGCFTGAYAEHPFTKEPIPIYIGDYVLASYGTGAVMAVPCGDQRDYDFAKHFDLPIPNIFKDVDISEKAHEDKGNTTIINSDFLTNLPYKKAFKTVIYEMEKQNIGYKKINYRLRDAVFSRQRYWGEPFPVYYKDGMPQMIAKEHLPIELPEVENYLPTEDGKPPLGNAKKWHWLEYNGEGKIVTKAAFENSSPSGRKGGALELNTMPGWAGSSWYFNRYMDAHNTNEIASKEAMDYWQDVDLYIGGSEHATGHLLYARFWQKFLFDLGVVPKKEFAKKMINQGMILGESAFVYRLNFDDNSTNKKLIYVSKSLLITNPLFDSLNKGNFSSYFPKVNKKLNKNFNLTDPIYTISKLNVDVSFVNTSNELDIEAFKNWRKEYKDAEFILEDGKYIVGREVEKMSKSKYNVVNPDDICEEYGADSLRLFEMFLGPLEQAKPWKTAGISGVYSFLKKLWKLYQIDDVGISHVSNAKASKESLKTLHKTIKKVDDDITNFSFNTSVSSFMIAVNELTQQKCNSREVLEPLLVLISPYAPHIAEELWQKLGHNESISTVSYPVFDASHLVESNKTYPISFNGKMRFTLDLSLDLSKDEIEKAVMADERTQKQLDGRTPKKVIVVPGKIVNIVG